MTLSSIQEALIEVQAGRALIVLDDETDESKAHLFLAAEKITPKLMKEMKVLGGNTLHVSLEASRLIDLGFTTSFEDNHYRVVNTISLSAIGTQDNDSDEEKLVTINKLLDFGSTVNDFRQPGHIYITQAAFGGVLRRAGHIEASIDLTKLAGRLGLRNRIPRRYADPRRSIG
jgi:3,4-dihydroxy 2-butanone 4-phosphate synthase/GTP cyclohydrolase II